MREPDVFDGAYGRLAGTRLVPERCPAREAQPHPAAAGSLPRSRLLPRLALMPPRTAWRPRRDAAGRPLDALSG